jgi:hypothetical protein
MNLHMEYHKLWHVLNIVSDIMQSKNCAMFQVCHKAIEVVMLALEFENGIVIRHQL